MPGQRYINDDALIDSICEAVMSGLTPQSAAELNGVSPITLNRWLVTGKKDIAAYEAGEVDKLTRHAIVTKQVRTAIQRFKHRHASNIQLQSARDWKASAWLLERLAPEDYGRKDTHAINTGSNGISINVVPASLKKETTVENGPKD